ncbi:MAG: magnesium transporter [Ruminococcaceae bacterium]|nr:magnesium transporter [Oscillospiraceae bacterium]
MEQKQLELFYSGKYNELICELDQMNAVDIADMLSSLSIPQVAQIFRMLKKDVCADIFAEFDSDIQEALICSMQEQEISHFIDKLAMDDTVDMLEELPANVVERILKSTSLSRRKEINKFLQYPENSAGSIMTSELVRIKSSMTVSQAVEHVRSTGIDKETVYVIYVTDASRRLRGTLELKDLLFASPTERIYNIMDTGVIFAKTTDKRQTITDMISKYDLLALPIVDSEDRLVGIVTFDDALDVINDDATKDIEKMGAIVPANKPYLKTGVIYTWLQRIPWLLILMLSASLTGAIITHFEGSLQRAVVLTAFIPMLMGSGGNAGGQASVTVIRSMSLGEIRMKDFLPVLWKELRVSLLCGATLAVAAFAKVFLFDKVGVYVALAVSLTLLATVIVAKLVGASLPILAKRIGLDPAVMASPFITTIVDAISLAIYFSISTKILGI